MRVAVVGLGGVGAYLAANFARAGIELVGVARGAHLQAIQKQGLEIVEDNATWQIKIDAREASDLDGYFDIVLFCVKSYDLVCSYNSLASHVKRSTILISFSNGVDNGERLRSLSDSIVLDGCIYILSEIEKAGVIRKKGEVFSAVFGGEEEASAKLATLFEKADLRYKIASDIKTALWKKYLFISAFATLTSYYDESIGSIYEHHREEAKELLEEISSFAQSRGIEISDEVNRALQIASKLPYDSSTSMHLDFKNKKRVELDSLSAYVETPLMSKLYKALLERNT